MKQVIFVALPVIIFTAMLVVGINHEVEQQKEVAIMRNNVDNMSSQVERYIDMLDDASDMAVEIYDDFNTAAIGFYRQTNVDSMRVHYNDVRQCYKLAEKYTIDNVKVELQFSEILQRKNRQTDR